MTIADELDKLAGEIASHGVFLDRNDPPAVWNPLADDGDALRLAVKLNMHITNSPIDAWVSTPQVLAIEPLGGDKLAATRRAITRAAAEIAKVKEGKA